MGGFGGPRVSLRTRFYLLRASLWPKTLSKPPFHAVHNGHRGVVNALVAAGANVNAAENDGLTALMYAAKKNHG